MNNEKEQKKLNLITAVEAGAKAEEIFSFLAPILQRRKDQIIDELETKNFYYQNIDNNPIYGLQCELKVLKMIATESERLVSIGKEARQNLIELAEKPERAKFTKPLRY